MAAQGFQKMDKLHKKSKFNNEFAKNNKTQKEYEKSKSKKRIKKNRYEEDTEEEQA